MVQDIAPWKVLTRRKNLQADGTEGETKLNRVLGLWDLTALGVGSTLGAGVYVLAGQIAKEQAGPSVMISFAIAALASLLAGICYAEFGARVPKAGSAYIYSYVCIGEFVAFVIGWNLILEYVIGTAAVCRGISLYLDSLINDTLKTTFEEIAPMDVNILGDYFDFFAFLLVMVFGIALAFGVETSTMLNNFVTCLNIFILGFVIVAGAVKADFSNWTIDVSQVTTNVTDIGEGGYFPYGFQGTLQGAATCFFGFVGFDCIATTGEEVRNPRKNIPTSILLSLLIIFLCYFGISTVLTLMLPYYQQDANAPLPYAFEHIGWPVAMWIVTIGGLIGLLASLFGALFPLPRVIYSMAQDGLLFRSWGKISPKYRVPVKGSIVAAVFTAFIAGFFDLAQLVSLLSIGTLLAYSVVAISITILRYMEYSESFSVPRQKPSTETTSLTMRAHRFTWGGVFKQLFNVNRLEEPNLISTRIVGVLATFFCLLSLGVGLIITLALPSIKELQAWALTLLILFAVLICVVLVLICLQPREPRSGLFRVPFVPLVPAISIFINIYLMLQLDSWTWIRFGIWMIVGIPTYIACWFLYDAKNPRERNPERIAYYKELKLYFDPPNKGTSEESVLTQTTSIKRSPTSSLDQIQTLSEIGDDLIEIRQHSSNGKLFYVEETKNDENSTAMSNGSVGLGGEDERSVIAMLDDVLEAEDNAQHQHIFERNFSLDSEMYPSVIETTIVATVHNSSSDEELTTTNTTTTTNNNNNNNDNSVRPLQLNRYEEYQIVAKEMLEEMFNSVAFYQQLEMARVVRFEVKESSNELKRIESVDSIVDDPLHSENFKSRLSNLILNASGQAAAVAAAKINNKKIDEPEANKPEVRQLRPPLKQSKSETDLRQLMLKAINELKTHDNEEASASTSSSTAAAAVAAGIVTADSNVKASTSVAVASATATTAYRIPRAPKFDPVLYKTINSISWHKQRPTFSKELVVDARNLEVAGAIAGKEEPSSPEQELESLPFKAKLEAILRRGPSHPTQRQRPGANIRRRPQSTHVEEMAAGGKLRPK
ncbi:cationic amino acid transporter 3 isoform X1 [Drosophila tropicalis]|uniref:cationic amino acid transporter 3 isoform X1 n=1 Tax=Drosophila tropicalis TaxID=46794 RepID=UPI0035AB9D72